MNAVGHCMNARVGCSWILGGRKRVTPAGHVENGMALLAKAVKLELEGVVAKRAESIYTAGRSRQWLKIMTRAGREREAIRLRHLKRLAVGHIFR